MSEPFFSVVIPAYNAAGFIAKTLDSVAAQTCRDFEVIATDDGSRDETRHVVETYLARHGLAGSCIRQENRGIAAARNTAMRAARGAWVALLDHDDIWYPGKLAAVSDAIRRHPEAILVGHHINMTRDGRLLATMRKGPAVPRMYERLLFGGNAVGTSAASFRRDRALEIGGFREDAALSTVEDYDFWMRLSRAGPFFFIDEVLAEYPLVANSASSRVEFHHANLEGLLREHFAAYFQGRPGLWGGVLMRRRLAAVYRSAAGHLAAAGAPRRRRWEYVRRMLETWPLDWKNLARGALWVMGR